MGVQVLDGLSAGQLPRRKAGSGWKASGSLGENGVSTSSHEEKEEVDEPEGLGLKRTRSLTECGLLVFWNRVVLMLWVKEIEQPLTESHMQSALRGSPGPLKRLRK